MLLVFVLFLVSRFLPAHRNPNFKSTCLPAVGLPTVGRQGTLYIVLDTYYLPACRRRDTPSRSLTACHHLFPQ